MDPTYLTLEKCREIIEQKLFNNSTKTANRDFVGLVGLELESIPVFCPFPGHHQKIPDLFGHDFSVANALLEISRRKDQNITGYPDKISLSGGSGFQFEPGGQTEITTRPCQSLTELKNELAFCQEIQEKVTEEFSIQFIQHGINPWFNEFEIGLQNNKQRYKTMAQYFDEIGPYGRKMMVQSCSMHINLDFGEDWDTRISRFILSNLLVPFSSVLFANSAIVSGKKSMHKSYRRFIWNHLDPTRTGMLDLKGLSGLPDKDWIIDKYLEFVLNAPLIYIEGTDESEAPLKISLDKWLKKPV
ncbi:MAG: hypothetical protein KJO29_00610, partial [Bacteroidia bacterium]|nr:hypothetical protein [Bacteroidia bacterium]